MDEILHAIHVRLTYKIVTKVVLNSWSSCWLKLSSLYEEFNYIHVKHLWKILKANMTTRPNSLFLFWSITGASERHSLPCAYMHTFDTPAQFLVLTEIWNVFVIPWCIGRWCLIKLKEGQHSITSRLCAKQAHFTQQWLCLLFLSQLCNRFNRCWFSILWMLTLSRNY